MTFEELKQSNNLLLLDCISGSTAYNLNTEHSDLDKKGVFITPKTTLFGFEQQTQIASARNDEVYFEVGRFIDLLTKNNPNILELLSTPAEFVLYRHPLMDLVKPKQFLSKLCLNTFAGYAYTQIKKAKGLNKKINQPLPVERKSVLDFCYVIYNNGSISLQQWLKLNWLDQAECGLVSVDHFRNVYLLYSSKQLSAGNLRGIVSGQDANDVQLSQVPKGINHLAVMSFNKDGYSMYCREYREYKEWEENRNEERFRSTLSHGKSYDAKNMMHTIRLLNMAEEIAIHQQIFVERTDREFLLSIRRGEFEFAELMVMIEKKMKRIEAAYAISNLPERPDTLEAERILVEIRENYYR
ncbi:DNA polymerase beta superfamily protein [Mucilaginibacter auburnensis]|uniref:Putative nucleotidyltransferase n=1 Tax=Mucilaginibacter auburnensis TaxID=1457233 RepID=A0A2H9VQ95_9SPHI|nr:nucleotidyltransferase domain-containing protein [Mucilaginibacter auburnensis]PJJ80497.1 putative nucleotidyltransferase [Mucilaginibacter auburnensis]